MSAVCRSRRTCGSVGGGRLFLGAAAQAGLLLTQEDERGGEQREVVMQALPGATLKVVQAEFLLGFAVVLRHPPARPRRGDEFAQGRFALQPG